MYKNKINKVITYAHNLSFHGLLIINSLNMELYQIKKYSFIISEKNLYTFTIVDNFKKKIEFRCSHNILPFSLKSLAYNFLNIYNINPPKLFFTDTFFDSSEIVVNENDFNDNNTFKEFIKSNEGSIVEPKSWLIKYSKLNTKILYDSLLKYFNILIKVLGINIINKQIYSLASISLNLFIEEYNIENPIISINEDDSNNLRNAYFGGRNEVFSNPEQGNIIYYYDFPAFYGNILKSTYYPTGYPIYVEKPNNLKVPGFYFVKVSSNIDLPILPYKSDDGLIFPNGIFSGLFWSEELNLFIEEGGIILDILYGYLYLDDFIDKSKLKKFDKFILRLELLKNEGQIMSKLCKLLINSFYGKLAFKDDNSFTFFVSKEDFYNIISKWGEEKNYSDFINYTSRSDLYSKSNFLFLTIDKSKNTIFKKLFLKKQNLKKTINNVGISSITTSRGRIKIYKLIKMIGDNNARIHYTDTDSVYYTFNKNANFENHKKLDFIARYKDGIFIRNKLYILKDFKDNIVQKGLVSNLSNDKFTKIKNTFFNKSLKLKTVTESRNSLKFDNFYPKNKACNITIDLEGYTKRIFNEDKKSTKPIIIIEE